MGLLAEQGGVVNELPLSPNWIGIIALILFALLLAVTLAFRSVAHRHDPAAFSGDHGSPSAGGSGGH
jgi:hypothetical protein